MHRTARVARKWPSPNGPIVRIQTRLCEVRALLIQHDHICTPGFVGERLTDRGLDLVLHQVVREDRFLSPNVEIEFPDPTDFDAIVPMGAPWSVYDHEAIGTWVPTELKMLRDAHDHQVPVLGICFGGQMLAAAHGGSVSRLGSSGDRLGGRRFRRRITGSVRVVVPMALRPVAAARRRRRRWRATPRHHRLSYSVGTSPCSFIPK